MKIIYKKRSLKASPLYGINKTNKNVIKIVIYEYLLVFLKTLFLKKYSLRGINNNTAENKNNSGVAK